jgi:succinate dehydrogenase flavin-adding protein (antitoxin of CptAB toxin-antitoxin module)
MTDEEVDALSRLLDLADNDLMDLLLARKEPEGEVDLPQVTRLLARLRKLEKFLFIIVSIIHIDRSQKDEP